jgi:hypothetical protein
MAVPMPLPGLQSTLLFPFRVLKFIDCEPDRENPRSGEADDSVPLRRNPYSLKAGFVALASLRAIRYHL